MFGNVQNYTEWIKQKSAIIRWKKNNSKEPLIKTNLTSV